MQWLTSGLVSGLVLAAAAACGDSKKSDGCFSDQEICDLQAMTGTLTSNQVREMFGNPSVSQSVSSGTETIQQWVYVCSQTAQSLDAVQLVFDETGVLEFMQVIRQGTGVAPAPTCP